ncbi:MAG TPA: GNAT family N-acetyltransferase [Ignavibacteriaceae bacterium]|nr:GNAT family N-acetyltransferase [Ignavibacteriaceae bacterium]
MDYKIKIRYAVPEDVHIIHQLIKELAEFEKLLDQVKTSKQDLQKVLFGEKSFVEIFIAEFDNITAGYALFFPNFSTFIGKPGIYLEDLFVKPEYRGKGIGKALLEAVISLAKERNCGRVEWSVLNWNKSAIDFYNARGAHQLEDWQIFRLTEDKF